MPIRPRRTRTKSQPEKAAEPALSPGERLLKVPEAAEELGVCVRTLRKWMALRLIPFVRLPGGDLIRFRRSALERFIAKHEQRAL